MFVNNQLIIIHTLQLRTEGITRVPVHIIFPSEILYFFNLAKIAGHIHIHYYVSNCLFSVKYVCIENMLIQTKHLWVMFWFIRGNNITECANYKKIYSAAPQVMTFEKSISYWQTWLAFRFHFFAASVDAKFLKVGIPTFVRWLFKVSNGTLSQFNIGISNNVNYNFSFLYMVHPHACMR